MPVTATEGELLPHVNRVIKLVERIQNNELWSDEVPADEYFSRLTVFYDAVEDKLVQEGQFGRTLFITVVTDSTPRIWFTQDEALRAIMADATKDLSQGLFVELKGLAQGFRLPDDMSESEWRGGLRAIGNNASRVGSINCARYLSHPVIKEHYSSDLETTRLVLRRFATRFGVSEPALELGLLGSISCLAFFRWLTRSREYAELIPNLINGNLIEVFWTLYTDDDVMRALDADANLDMRRLEPFLSKK